MLRIMSPRGRQSLLLRPTARTAEITAAADAMSRAMAVKAQGYVRDDLKGKARTWTGNAARHVQVARTSSSRYEVTDSGLVYWPWLNGTARRNRTSRFKGYKSFSAAALRLAREAPALLRAPVQTLIARLSR